MANFLKHKIAETYSGPDGIDCDGECEYKSTIDKNIKATYNGISVQDTWENQVEYLTNKKLQNIVIIILQDLMKEKLKKFIK